MVLIMPSLAAHPYAEDEETDPDDAKDIVKLLTHPHLSRPALMPRRGWTSLRHTEAPAGHTSHGECGGERGADGQPGPAPVFMAASAARRRAAGTRGDGSLGLPVPGPLPRAPPSRVVHARPDG